MEKPKKQKAVKQPRPPEPPKSDVEQKLTVEQLPVALSLASSFALAINSGAKVIGQEQKSQVVPNLIIK